MLNKILLRLNIELNFLLIQKWGLLKSGDLTEIPKYKIKKYLGKNPIIIDCGAHVGADSIELSKLLPKATIHAFEPVPRIFESLKRNTRRYKNINCFPLALSNQNGIADFFVSSGASDASSSLLKPSGHLDNHPDVLFKENISVNTMTLDDWAINNNIRKVDFLWLDMQGFELEMLKASRKIIDTVKVIYTEVSLVDTYLNAPLYKEYKMWLERKGFKTEIEYLPYGGDMGNVLFIKK